MKLNIITRRSIIEAVPQAWAYQYADYASGDSIRDQGIIRTTQALAAIPKAELTPEAIAAIVGNDSWTVLECNVCGKRDCEAIARIGEEPDYEARWLDICLPCLVELGESAKAELGNRP